MDGTFLNFIQPQKRKQNLSDSSRRQIDSTTLGLTSLTSFPQMSQTLASKFSSIRKSFRGSKNSIKKVWNLSFLNFVTYLQSLTTPEFSLNRSNASDNVFEDSQDVESQNNNNGVGRNSLRVGV